MNERARNRAAFPKTAAIFDHWNALFPGCRLLWAEEDGRELGRRDTRPWVPCSIPHKPPKEER